MAAHRLFILVFAALLFLPVNAAAQVSGQYRAWDRNNDGVISRWEWRGDAQEFRDLDWNRDGVLSGSELRDQSWRSSDRWDNETFLTLDRNRNGSIARGEWRGDPATFRELDRNGDNQITRAEFLNADAGHADGRSDFDALDYDNSGRIERDEWEGTRAAFNRFDVNRDGTITRREYRESGLNDAVNAGGRVQESVIVDARQPWTDTGLHVNAGDVVRVRAQGTIQMSTDPNDRATPAGALSGRNASNSPRPDQSAGGLLVRIDNGGVEFVGANGSFRAQNNGRLYFGVNDDHFPDNGGEYRVWVSIDR
jgi:EF-hand domain pair/EF hand